VGASSRKTAPPNQTVATKDENATSEKLPRLCACINEMVLCDRSAAGDNTATIPEGQEPNLGHVQQVIDWIAMILEQDAVWNIVWQMPGGRHPAGADNTPDEKWAKIVEEIFLGSAYMGPDGLAGFPSKGQVKGTKIGYIYGRFQPTTWSSRPGNGPNAPVERVESPNTDPARSIGVVCQSLTTYGMMARGMSLEHEIGPGGLPASQDALAAPMFHEGGVGAWYANSVVAIFNREGKIDSSFVGVIDKDQAFNGDAVAARARNFGPGTIYTYNPRGNQRTTLVDVPISDLWLEADGTPRVGADGNYQVSPLAGINKELEMQAGAKAVDHASDIIHQTVPLLPAIRVSVDVQTQLLRANPQLSEEEKIKLGIQTATLTFRLQTDGSHISMVLRTWTNSSNHVAVQMLDASYHRDPDDPAYTMFKSLTDNGGMYAGESSVAVPGERDNFVGLGTVPPLTDFDAQLAHLRRVRPVGLMRLVVAKRNPEARAEMSAEDILFISRLVPMWSSESPERNYNFSRLLVSLRDVPYYGSLQAFWVCYAPRDALAEVMWEEGARGRKIEDMVDDALARSNAYHPVRDGKPIPREELTVGEDMMPIAVLSHHTDGKAHQLWRAHQMKGGGGDGSPPKAIRQVFIDTGALSGDLITKRQKELEKAYRAELARLVAVAKAAQVVYENSKSTADRDIWLGALKKAQTALDPASRTGDLKAYWDFFAHSTRFMMAESWYLQLRAQFLRGGWLGEGQAFSVPGLLGGTEGYQGYASKSK